MVEKDGGGEVDVDVDEEDWHAEVDWIGLEWRWMCMIAPLLFFSSFVSLACRFLRCQERCSCINSVSIDR